MSTVQEVQEARALLAPRRAKVSAEYRDGVPAERNLPFRTARELATTTPAAVPWCLEPWVADGAVSILFGKVKSGKTTWTLAAVRAKLDGRPFLGRPTTPAPVLYLTEQPDASLRPALERAGLAEREDLIILSWYAVRGRPWPEIAELAEREATRRGARLLVVDTLGQWAGLDGDDENKAGEALAAMRPLQAAAASGLGVLLLGHERKSGGDVGDSGRGSSAFAGASDVVLALRRPEGQAQPNVRVLHALSRFAETPDTLAMELREDGTYHALGDSAALALYQAREAILDAAPAPAGALELDGLLDRAGVKRTTGQEAIKLLLKEGRLVQVGEGKRGDPRRYHRPTPEKVSAGTPSLYSAETNGRCEEEAEVFA